MNEKLENFIKQNRKICWESEYENDEYCIGENKVRQFFESNQVQAGVKPANGGQIHALKTWCEYYRHIIDGSKTFEIRKNDRNFKVGDVLVLQEFNKDRQQYTGKHTSRIITYITDFNQQDGYVVLGLSRLSV